ncbi:MAG: HEAT repeat domain-containing protein [Flavobacterium sp.]
MFSINKFQILLSYFSPKFILGEIKIEEYWHEQLVTIKIIWILTFFFLFLFFAFFSVLIVSRVVKNIQKRKRERLKKKFQTPFSFYLFDDNTQKALLENNYNHIIDLFGRHNIKKAFNRYVLRKELMRLHNNYSGDIAVKLKQLFSILGFDKEVKNKIMSRRWNIKANAINEAAQMNLVQYSEYILNLINHPNSVVRTEARVASVKLNKKEPFTFFNNLQFNMSVWDQIRIHDALMLYENAEVPLMGKWLFSSNESVVVFSLKIIGYYNQEEEINQVIECLNNPSENIKIQAVKTLGELGSKQSLATLFDCLKDEKDNKKIIIQTLQSLKLIGIFDTDEDKIKEFLFTNDYDIIFSSCLTLKSAPNGIAILEKNISEADESVVNIMKYALSFTN